MSMRRWYFAVSRSVEETPSGFSYHFDMTLDRTFGDTPAARGGNLSPLTFTHGGNNWELWQCVPFLGPGVGPQSVGDCRVQLRNRDKGRGQNTLDEMPDRAVINTDNFIGTPWEFTRPTAGNKFTSPGSGNNARRAIDYEPVHTPAANPAAAGVVQPETFTLTITWDN